LIFMQYYNLHTILTLFFLLGNICVLTSQNPVHSVLFLILTFVNAATILFVFNIEFLGLIFIIIYVGAIAVLFLFVVMMLNVKINSVSKKTTVFYLSILSIFFIYVLSYINTKVFNTEKINILESFELYFDKLTNIDLLGQSLYNNYLICFIIAGLILLIAMIGAISLTLHYKSERKNELVIRQLSRSDNFLAFFK
jgi:NADH-quinone oxidoreductase subunit J